MNGLVSVFDDLQLNVSWTLIEIGLNFIDYNYRVKPSDVIEYAERIIAGGKSKELVVDLLWCENQPSEMMRIVKALANNEFVDYEVEKRKWVVYVLKNALNSISIPPTAEELFELSSLWLYLGTPNHYPWDVCNSEYFKCNDYSKMLNIHIAWIDNEVKTLRKIQES